MKPTPKTVDDTLDSIARASEDTHPTRQLARGLVAVYRKGTAINPDYDFNAQPLELKQVVYDGVVRFSRRRWYARLFR